MSKAGAIKGQKSSRPIFRNCKFLACQGPKMERNDIIATNQYSIENLMSPFRISLKVFREKKHCDWCHFLSPETNLALRKPTWQSSDLAANISQRAVDDNKNTYFDGNSCTHTAENGDTNPWFAVDLQGQFVISGVNVTNRGEGSGRIFLLITTSAFDITNDVCIETRKFDTNPIFSRRNVVNCWTIVKSSGYKAFQELRESS